MTEPTPETSAAPVLATQDEAPVTKKERRLGCVFAGIAFGIGYVLSAGPAVFVADKMDVRVFSKAVQLVYLPLVLIVKADIPVIAPVIKTWVSLFQ